MTTFDTMYRKYYLRVLRYFMRAFHLSQEDAEELTQDTFMRFFRALHEYRGEAEWAFLETTARNVGLNRVRANNTQRRNGITVDLEDREVFAALSTEPNYVERDELARQRKLLYDAIDQLPKAQRQCLLLSLEGFRYTEVARTLRVTPDAVKSRLRDAKRTLRAKLGADVELPEDDE